MKVAIIYNKDISGVINKFGMQNKEFYSEKTISRVAKSLEKAGHNVSVIDGNMKVIERLQSFMPRVIEGEQMGMVFNMAYGIQGESRYTHIPAMLEMLGIPYVGSSPSGHALALDKVLTKIIWQKHGIPTPKFWIFNSPDENLRDVEYPVIVKPKMESVSFGLKVVQNEEDLKEAVHFIVTEFQQPALVEQFIRGREFCVGILGNNPEEIFPILEIDLGNDPDAIQTVDNKKYQPRAKICPANLTKEVEEKMKALSVDAFRALNLRDFSRVDIRMDESGEIHLLEINSMASLGETGSYPTMAKVAGYSFETLVNRILDVASVRYFSDSLMNRLPQETGKRLPVHSRQRAFIKGRLNYYEKLLQKAVNINTYYRNREGVNNLSSLLHNEFAQLGFAQEVFPQLESGNHVYFSNSHHEEKDVLLLGHLDYNVKISEQENYHEDEYKMYGSGIWSQKGGMVVTIAALQALRFVKSLRNLKIGILLVADHHNHNKSSSEIILTKSLKARHIIGISGGGVNGELVLSRSGAASYNYQIKLTDSSSEEYVSVASTLYHKFLAAVSEMSQKDKDLTISPYRSDFKSNIFQCYAFGQAGVSIRYNHPNDFKEIDARIKKLVPRKYRNIINHQLEGGINRQPMESNEKSREFYEFIRKIAGKADIRVLEEHRWSSSEISYASELRPRIDGFGPMGEITNRQVEYIKRQSLLDRSVLLASTLYNLSSNKS